MSEADKIFMGIFLVISHIGFWFWGFSYAVRLVNEKANK